MERRRVVRIAVRTLVALNVAAAAIYLAGAYIGYVNPSSCGYLALLPLAYPVLLAIVAAFLLVWLFAYRRNLLISGVALAATVPQIWSFSPLNIASDADGRRDFRLMTYNVHGMARGDSANVSTVGEILRLDPDFVCLQESAPEKTVAYAFRENGEWEELRRRYPYMTFDDTTSLGFLSKTPFSTVLVRDNGNYFSYAVYRTEIERKPAFFVSLHLESIGLNDDDKQLYMQLTSPDDSRRTLRGVRSRLMSKLLHAFKERAAQAQEVRHCADSLAEAVPEARIFVCGDFNDTPYSYSYLTVRGGMEDAFSDGAFGPSISYNMNRFYFRIDHIFYSGGVEAFSAFRGESRASDHYPIVADFRIED